ncbi:hypothetical protein [Burkholderia phage BCSR5]|nr:hypothetical protein [Burkholderia phage BCSR5]
MIVEEIKKVEKRLDVTRANLELWRREHHIHNDTSSHRCYSRALLQHLTVLDVFVTTLGISLNEKELEAIRDEWDKVDQPLPAMIDGRIRPRTECPYRAKCEIAQDGACHHLGVKHLQAFSCATARGFALVERNESEEKA